MSSVIRAPLIKTLRSRLTVWHLATLTLTLGVFAFLCYLVLERSLYRHHDEELERQASELVEGLGTNALTESEIQGALLRSPVGSRLVMIRDDKGELIYREASLDATEPHLGKHAVLMHAAMEGRGSPEFFTVDLERSGEVRFICVPLKQPRMYLQVGDPLGDVRETLRHIAWTAAPLIPIVLLFSTFGGWLIAKRALAPMRSVSTSLEAIQATDLSRRVEVRSTDEEITALVSTLNQLLDRLARAFDGLRQFAGDVSHQLRTPLTVMKGTLEDAARPDRTLAADTEVLKALHEEVDEMSAIIGNLRAFALADAPNPREVVDLSEVAREASDIVSALGELRGVAVSTAVEPEIRLSGDAIRLKQVMLNLGDNAVSYTPAGKAVELSLRREGNTAVIKVVDEGVGIPPEQQSHLFDRLYRGDPTPRRPDGTGLGLAIAKRIVDAHRGTIAVESESRKGSTFTVRLPLT